MNDKQKVLRILQERGEQGIHSFHLNHLVGTIRSASRISELKKEGYVIKSVVERVGSAIGRRYTLIGKTIEKAVVQESYMKFKYVFDNETGTAHKVYASAGNS